MAQAAQFAYETNDDFLQEMCFKFVRDNFSKILDSGNLSGIEEQVVAGFISQVPANVHTHVSSCRGAVPACAYRVNLSLARPLSCVDGGRSADICNQVARSH